MNFEQHQHYREKVFRETSSFVLVKRKSCHRCQLPTMKRKMHPLKSFILHSIKWVIIVSIFSSSTNVVEANPDAKRLYDDLLSTYNRLIRPVSNNTDTVLVKLGLRLSQLIDLVRWLMFIKIMKNSTPSSGNKQFRSFRCSLQTIKTF